MSTDHYSYNCNTITALAPASEHQFLSPSTGMLTVTSAGKLKIEIYQNSGSLLYVAFCAPNSTVANIPINAHQNIKITNMDHSACNVYTTVVTERPQISFNWNS